MHIPLTLIYLATLYIIFQSIFIVLGLFAITLFVIWVVLSLLFIGRKCSVRDVMNGLCFAAVLLPAALILTDYYMG